MHQRFFYSQEVLDLLVPLLNHQVLELLALLVLPERKIIRDKEEQEDQSVRVSG